MKRVPNGTRFMRNFPLWHFINEDTDALWCGDSPRDPMVGHIGNDARMGAYALHIAWAFGIEDKAHHINRQAAYCANVVGLAHATNFYYHEKDI